MMTHLRVMVVLLITPLMACATRHEVGDVQETVKASAGGAAALATGAYERARLAQPMALMPEAAYAAVFERSDEGHHPKRVRLKVERPAPGDWKLTLTDVGSATYRASADGLLLVREEDLRENVAVTYDPALLALPVGLATGEVRETAGRVTIRDMANGQKRDEGTVTYRVELLGRGTVQTPAGRFDAVTLRSTRSMKLSLAEVDAESVRALVPGRGMVAEQASRQVRALGLFTRDRRHTMELAE